MSALNDLCQVILTCQKCPTLVESRTKVVPGDGAEEAKIMFIGEAPGFHEDQQGKPFVGPAGMFLNQLIASIGLRREQVYITNVIKCRPPNNRDPLPVEVHNCQYWLDSQIELINPKMIVALGRYSMSRFFPGKSISKIHGTAYKQGNIIHYAMYHPAAALHQQSLRQQIEADMLKIPPLLAESETVEETTPPPKQLNMFEAQENE